MPTFCSFLVGFCFCFWLLHPFHRISSAFVSANAHTHSVSMYFIKNLCPKKEQKKQDTAIKSDGFCFYAHLSMRFDVRSRATHFAKSNFCIFAKLYAVCACMYTNGSKWWSSKRWICDKTCQTQAQWINECSGLSQVLVTNIGSLFCRCRYLMSQRDKVEIESQ